MRGPEARGAPSRKPAWRCGGSQRGINQLARGPPAPAIARIQTSAPKAWVQQTTGVYTSRRARRCAARRIATRRQLDLCVGNSAKCGRRRYEVAVAQVKAPPPLGLGAEERCGTAAPHDCAGAHSLPEGPNAPNVGGCALHGGCSYSLLVHYIVHYHRPLSSTILDSPQQPLAVSSGTSILIPPTCQCKSPVGCA